MNFEVTQGGGSVSVPGGTTGSNGRTQVAWTIGTTAGAPQAVRVTAGSLTPVIFGATAVAGAPTSVSHEAGNGQTAATSNPVAIPPAVRLSDAFNNPVPNVVVAFGVTAGGGTVTKPSDTTDASGIATVGSWTLGNSAGQNDLTATVSGTALSFTFVATAATPGAPALVVVREGNDQTSLAGFPVNENPAVLVLDASNLPVPNVQVDFVPSGGSSVTGTPVVTNVNGVAAVASWTVPLGAHTLTATASGAAITGNPVTFFATGVTASFNIVVRYLTSVSASRSQVFDDAAARWQGLVYGDVPDVVGFNIEAGQCGANAPAFDETVDDVIILVTLDSIDGPGRILGQAGPCWIRDPDYRPILGLMRFDTADVANLESNGRFDEVILHEMGHVLGYGTIWPLFDLLVGPAAFGGTDPHFVGAQATTAFDRNGGQNYSAGAKVPVENCVGISGCGGGNWDGHWRESVFEAELMTGFLDGSVPNPLSVVSTASLGDLGYMVNYAGSDPYTVTNPLALRAKLQRPRIELWDDILRLPIGVVNAAGRVVRVIQPRRD